MVRATKAARIGKGCVACGCCANVCPKGAIRIEFGITACVYKEVCIGCGKCARECPDAVILIAEREEAE